MNRTPLLQFVLRTVLTAIVLTYVLPMVGGYHFYGTLWPWGVVYALLLTVVSWAFWRVMVLVGLATGGIAFLFLIFGWFLIPAILLELLAGFFPQHLVIDSFGTAFVAGLLMMIINTITKRL